VEACRLTSDGRPPFRRYLIEEMGPAGFRAELEKRMGVTLATEGESLIDPNWKRRSYYGVNKQKDGNNYVGVCIPVRASTRLLHRKNLITRRSARRLPRLRETPVYSSLLRKQAGSFFQAGRMSPDDMMAVAHLAETYGDGT
jgi:sulfite reductase beta subunit-like hemoprotein